MREGVNPGDIRVRPRTVGVVEVWMCGWIMISGWDPIFPGWRFHFMYEPRPTDDQAKRSYFSFRLTLEPEIINCQHLERCSTRSE